MNNGVPPGSGGQPLVRLETGDEYYPVGTGISQYMFAPWRWCGVRFPHDVDVGVFYRKLAALEAENARLREALEQISEGADSHTWLGIARAALARKEE